MAAESRARLHDAVGAQQLGETALHVEGVLQREVDEEGGPADDGRHEEERLEVEDAVRAQHAPQLRTCGERVWRGWVAETTDRECEDKGCEQRAV